MSKKEKIMIYIFIMFMTYFGVAMNYYWATHPELTQMEMFQHVGDALMWRD